MTLEPAFESFARGYADRKRAVRARRVTRGPAWPSRRLTERGSPPLSQPRPLIAGNWKMHGRLADLDEARALAAELETRPAAARVALCPPATLIAPMADLMAGTGVEVGAQDCRPEPSGAFTGCLSAEMLAEAGASLVILGHSERRAYCGETDADVAAKALGALRAGLEPIICVGETLGQRDAGRALEVVMAQLAGSVPPGLAGRAFCIAYEPVWAIGTGRTPTSSEIEQVHAAIRAGLTQRFAGEAAQSPILYGGSVKPSNAQEILALREVDGALVGGASLTAAEFIPIVRAL